MRISTSTNDVMFEKKTKFIVSLTIDFYIRGERSGESIIALLHAEQFVYKRFKLILI